MSVKDLVKRVLTEKENKKYYRRLDQAQVTYADWIARLEALQADRESIGRKGVDQESDIVERDFVVVCASKGILAKRAITSIKRYFKEYPDAQLVYGDEDVWPGCGGGGETLGERRHPWFKPDWSPDLLDSCPYFGSVIALRKDLFDKLQEELGPAAVRSAALHGEKDTRRRTPQIRTFFPRKFYAAVGGIGAGDVADFQVTDLDSYSQWLRSCMDLAGACEKGSHLVGHIPTTLFHCDNEEEQIKFLKDAPFLRACRAKYVHEFHKRWSEQVTSERNAGTETVKPVVSIVIPSKDHPEILEKCLRGCRLAGQTEIAPDTQKGKSTGELEQEPVSKEEKLTGELPLEILVVDNGSSRDNRERITQITKKLASPAFQIRYLYHPMEFNFSRMCNLGAQHARGQFFLFLNDDVELLFQGCLEEMAALASRPNTGAVGLKLLYPDSNRIQHAGITNLPTGPVHKLQFLDDGKCYYYGFNRGRRNVLAVTAACLMVERDKFFEAGCFSEEFKVTFNDVDFCFTLHEMGYWNVCLNDLYACHYESLSRGDDREPDKLERLVDERNRLYQKHWHLVGVDPFYSIYLVQDGLDTCTRIRPAYETAGNQRQQIHTPLQKFDCADCREDACLMVQIEDVLDGKIQGYGVVLGDNNACYDMKLLLRRELPAVEKDEHEDSHGTNGDVYAVDLIGQYRPDLAENMTDQESVALNGFFVEFCEDAVPSGRYLLGLTARNRVTGLKLINWSRQCFAVGLR